MATMTPEEKVGQLFLITFKGTDVSADSQIYDLIVNHHIGGVMLSAANDNFSAQGTVPDAYQLIGQLQADELTSSQHAQKDPVTETSFIPAYVPLIVGIDQEGDSTPTDQILTGLTQFPDEMAIGATWNPDNALQVGEAMGSELQAIGINLYMGPSLDVLEMSQPTGYNSLGTRSFGGDPFWVGEMGKAYISGLHLGSNGRIATIATHFPGSGSADRSPEEEVATVRKSLETLKTIELAPFFAVTGNAPSPEATTDGLLVSDIRYQGFQGNIRDTTKPVSFDPTALSQLMGLDQFTSWRADGLLVSDDLGSRAVRRFYDPTEKTFPARQVALDAFNAGNDLLYADNFVANGDPDLYTSLLPTLDLFAQKYRNDTAFRQRVDASVLRILTLKFRLYPTFKYTTVLPSEGGLDTVNNSGPVAYTVAKQSVTLISPSVTELDSLLPKPPQLNDHIVFFTDVLNAKQCTQCTSRSFFTIDGLQNAVLSIYGPQVGGQVVSDNMASYSFADLQNYLDNLKNAPATLATDLDKANWVIFSSLDIDIARPESSALKNLLANRPDLIHNKKVIVFAFNAPYFLDATDISKLTAYYGLYSKGPSFLDVAARVLFQELAPTTGALPVSVPGVGYDVIEQTSPDPTQTITLNLAGPGQPTEGPQTTSTPPIPTVIPNFQIGDTIDLQTGVIYDHNHNVVPDETGVQFTFTFSGQNTGSQQVETATKKGVASLTYRIDRSGQVQITANSGQAIQSNMITFNIPSGLTPGVTVIAPTLVPSLTPTATLVPTFTPTPTETVVPLRPGKPDMGEWTLAMLLIAVGGALAFITSYRFLSSLRWGIRWGLCTVLGGLVVYIYFSSGLPGGVSWIQQSGTGGVLEFSFLGVIIGWLIGLAWWITTRQLARRKPRLTP